MRSKLESDALTTQFAFAGQTQRAWVRPPALSPSSRVRTIGIHGFFYRGCCVFLLPLQIFAMQWCTDTQPFAADGDRLLHSVRYFGC